MKNCLLVFILVLIMAATSGCKSYDVASPACVLDNSCNGLFVENQTCVPPCWQGLTPGETSFTDALTILKDLDFIDQDIKVEEISDFRFKKQIQFDSRDGNWSGWACFDNGILYKLGFGGELFANFKNVAESIIEPSSVIVLRDHIGRLMFFVLDLEKGVLFTAGIDGWRKNIRIYPETPVVGLSYFDPKQLDNLYMDKLLLPYYLDETPWTSSIQPWLGYGTITDRYEVTEIE